MELNITNTNAAQSCIDQNDTMYKLLTKKHKRIYILLVMGILCCAYGIIEDRGFSGLSIFIDLGIVFIGVFFMGWRSMSVSNEQFKSEVLLLAAKYRKGSNTFLTEINETRVTTKSDELRKEIMWSYFRSYTVFENYIFITASVLNDSVIIDKRLLSEKEYAELIAFLESKLALRKY